MDSRICAIINPNTTPTEVYFGVAEEVTISMGPDHMVLTALLAGPAQEIPPSDEPIVVRIERIEATGQSVVVQIHDVDPEALRSPGRRLLTAIGRRDPESKLFGWVWQGTDEPAAHSPEEAERRLRVAIDLLIAEITPDQDCHGEISLNDPRLDG